MGKYGMTVFLDMEWSQENNDFVLDKCQLLQLAGIGVHDNSEETKKFYKAIKPDNIDKIAPHVFKLLGTNADAILRSPSKDIVLNRFFLTFDKVKTFIVWNRNTYDLLMYNVKQLKIKVPNHNIIVLQEMIDQISHIGIISFEKMLKLIHMEYRKEMLHHAKYDVIYLKNMYDFICEVFCKTKENRKIKLFQFADSKVIHAQDCRYLHSGKAHTVTESVELYGNCLCHFCAQNGEFKIMNWDRKNIEERVVKKEVKLQNNKISIEEEYLTEEYIYSLCDKYRLSGRVGVDGMLFVDTGRTKWRIYYDETKVVDVFHENYMPINREYSVKKSNNQGFHKQKFKKQSMDKVLAYIKSHDKGDIVKNKKSRIDMLFEKIERNEGIRYMSF